MPTIYELKEQAVTDTPILLFDCVLAGGVVERWCTHKVAVGGFVYQARIMQHNTFEMQTASGQGVDGIPRISIVLGNADSYFSELERGTGFKGARLTVSFLFYDLRNDTAPTEPVTLFQGVCNSPDEIREATFRVTATNRMNLQRMVLPQVRIQRRCPWEFPVSAEQRTEAVDGGTNGKYSRFYRCGYSAGVEGGQGNLNDGAPYTSCGFTRADCEARGMFLHFGGIEFVPPAISVRTYGDKSSHTSAVSVNEARYNDFVPMVYGTGWYTPPLVFARNDGNLTHMEILLGAGEMEGVLKVLVNDIEIPVGVSGVNMTGTGWYNIRSLGSRTGAQNADFTDSSGRELGDPYGSMAYLSVVLPNRINDGTSVPRVKVLAQGLKVPVYGEDGGFSGELFTNNPAWILLDVLRRTGWAASEIDIPSFARAATYCDERIAALDIYGNPITVPRFGCNLILTSRRSAGDVVRGIRNTARLLLTYGEGGAIRVRVENSVAEEWPSKPAWSNSAEPVDGGWPSYEFGDGSNGISGILRRSNGEPSVRIFSRGVADTPNRFSVEFQDELNEYQQDSYSLVDPDDIGRSGQEVSVIASAMGLPNYNQAGRVLKVSLDKSVRGNTYLEFDTSIRAFGIMPGDLITVTYLKEGFVRQPFRVLKIAPGTNHRVTTITAQIHEDEWYEDANGQPSSAAGGGRQGDAGIGVPRPLLGSELDENGDVQFGIEETAVTSSDGTVETSLTASFVAPAVAAGGGPATPMVSLVAEIEPGGTLAGGETLYYGITAVDADGNESRISFLVRAVVVNDGSKVTLQGLRFAPGTSTFHVYRGDSPARLFRIGSSLDLAAEFTDTGFSKEIAGPPDPNFDHANFYWRLELQPETDTTIHSPNSIGNGQLEMAANRYRGMVVRIISGRGAGQDRAVVANTATTITVSPAWAVEPDATSHFAIAEGSWKLGALTKSSPAQFGIPNRAGETVEIMGRSANVNNIESAEELATVTRWQIGGSGPGGDTGAPPTPFFGLGANPRGGIMELSGVSFTDLANTNSISSSTLTVYYWDELQGRPSLTLGAAIDATNDTIELSAAATAASGSFVQVDREVMRVEEVLSGGSMYRVTRGAHGSTASSHETGALVYRLAARTFISSFPAGFFGSPYSGSWKDTIPMADVRLASAELFVTNAHGNSPVASIYLTNNDDNGLRTLSGGQYSIQVEGFLAVDQSATPPLVVEGSHAIRDIYAILGKAADAPISLQLRLDGADYCRLDFAAGQFVSSVVDGLTVSPLTAGSKITLAVLQVGQSYPGGDLTVLIRL